MRVTLLLHGHESAFANVDPAMMGEIQAAFGAYTEELQGSGALVATDWLAPTSVALTLAGSNSADDAREGAARDGDLQLTGFYLIEVADMNEARTWAAKCPGAQHGAIEIRPSAMG